MWPKSNGLSMNNTMTGFNQLDIETPKPKDGTVIL